MVDQADMEQGEQTPLLSVHTGGDNLPLQDMTEDSIKEKVVTGFAGMGFITSLLSVLLEGTMTHPSVLISGILGMVLSPYTAFQQRKITQIQALKQTCKVMEDEVETLTRENDRLASQVEKLEASVTNLGKMEDTLEAINELQGESVEKLQQQLQDSKEILANMNRNAKSLILQTLITVLLATDEDQDFLLSDEEIDKLIHNLESIHGVSLKEDLIRQTIIEKGRCVAAIMDVAKNVDHLVTMVES